MAQWITHRLPTVEDADDDGEVEIPRKCLAGDLNTIPTTFQHFSAVVAGQPWLSENDSEVAQQEDQ
jgi:hypothetical protein